MATNVMSAGKVARCPPVLPTSRRARRVSLPLSVERAVIKSISTGGSRGTRDPKEYTFCYFAILFVQYLHLGPRLPIKNYICDL